MPTECQVTDSAGNHCPEPAVHQGLCEKCYQNVVAGAYGLQPYQRTIIDSLLRELRSEQSYILPYHRKKPMIDWSLMHRDWVREAWMNPPQPCEIRRVTGKASFNIGISTGLSSFPEGRWGDPYLHWLFVPREHEIDGSRYKPRKK